MLGRIALLFALLAHVNCQLYRVVGPAPAPSCGCNAPVLAPPVKSPCLCAGPSPLEALLATLAPLQTAPCACNTPIAPILPTCGCKKVVASAPIAPPCTTALAPPCAAPVVAPAPVPVYTSPPCAKTLPAPSCGCSPVPSCGCAPVPSCGCSPVPNPFLPAASPVSAFTPQLLSPLLPPVCPCENRNLYLRKIPIPPPCL